MKKSANFQGDMLSFCGTITIFVFTTNHLLKVTIHSDLNLVRNCVENCIYADISSFVYSAISVIRDKKWETVPALKTMDIHKDNLRRMALTLT